MTDKAATATQSAMNAAISSSTSITHSDMLAHYDRERERLLSLSKEELVELLIGKRENVGLIFG